MKIASSSAAPLRLARSLVSGSKTRFKDDDFDLDLCYVLPRLIALGLPASGLEQLYRDACAEAGTTPGLFVNPPASFVGSAFVDEDPDRA